MPSRARRQRAWGLATVVLLRWRRRSPRWPRVTRQTFYREVVESDRPVLVELFKDGVDYDVFERAIEDVARRHPGDFRLVHIRVDEFADLIDAYRHHKGYATWNFDRLPAAALFRKGQLVTTFNPTLPLGEESIRYHDIHYQFERFLQKFVYYDPAKVTFNHKRPESPSEAKKPAMPAGAGVAGGPTGQAGAADDRAARIAAAKAAAAAKLAARQAAQQQQAQVAEPGPQASEQPAAGGGAGGPTGQGGAADDRAARIAAAKAAAMAKLAQRQAQPRQAAAGDEGQGRDAERTS